MTEPTEPGNGHEDTKKAEQAAYARGYAAGRRKRKADDAADRYRREQQAFLDKALLALLPACMNAQGWKIGDDVVTDAKQRVRLAVLFADEALRQRRIL